MTTPKKGLASRVSRLTARAQDGKLPDYLILHIGKTGGTSIGRCLRKARKHGYDPRIGKLGHQFGLKSVMEACPDRKVGFVVRAPESRFVSGFNSRLRSGRPAHARPWKTAEAAAYAFFPTANDLAEALYSDDERLLSAARFAMRAIPHLRRNLAFYLGGIDLLEAAGDRIYCVAEVETLDTDIYRLLGVGGLTREHIAALYQPDHQAPYDSPPLSEKGRANLQAFWAKDYEIYAYCRAHLLGR